MLNQGPTALTLTLLGAGAVPTQAQMTDLFWRTAAYIEWLRGRSAEESMISTPTVGCRLILPYIRGPLSRLGLSLTWSRISSSHQENHYDLI
jgi:hypothetical protein